MNANVYLGIIDDFSIETQKLALPVALLLIIVSICIMIYRNILARGNWINIENQQVVVGTQFKFPFGDLSSIRKDIQNDYLFKLHRQLGSPKIYRIWMGTCPALVMAHPDAVRDFWRAHDEKTHLRVVQLGWALLLMMGEGVGFKKYKDRNRINKFFQNSFGPGQVLEFEHDIGQIVNGFMKELMTKIEKAEDKIIDITHALQYLAHDACISLILGSTGQKYKSELHSFVDEMVYLMTIIFDALWINIDGLRLLLPAYHRLRSGILNFRSKIKQFLLDRMKDIENSDSVNATESILHRYVHDIKENKAETTFDELLDTIIEALIAPDEFASGTFAYSLLLIAMHPHIQDEIRQQIQEKYSGTPSLSEIRIIDLNSIPYLDYVFNEGQRLLPIFMFNVPEFTSRSMTICGVEVPKNTMIMLDVVSMNRNSDIWESPLEYRPERFAEKLSENQKKSVHAFGNGPTRRCLGQYIVKYIHKLLLVHILTNYEIFLPKSLHITNIESIQHIRRPFIYGPVAHIQFRKL